MTIRKGIIGLALILLAALGVWYAWDLYTTPKVPDIPLAGVGKEMAEAIEEAVQEVRRNPRSGEAWGELSLTLIANGFYEPAVTCIAEAHRFDPKQPRWLFWWGNVLLITQPQQGIPLLRRALTLPQSPESQAAILFPLVRALIEEGELDEAAERLQALREHEGETERVLFGLGLLAIAREDRKAARNYLAKLTDSPYARKRVSILLASVADDPKEALRYRQQGEKLPDDQPWQNIIEAGIHRYKVETRGRLAEYFRLKGQGQLPVAVDLLRQLVAQSPDEESCYWLGVDLLALREYQEAARALRQSLSFNPKKVKTQIFLGQALLLGGEMLVKEPRTGNAAQELFQQAIQAAEDALKIQNDAHAHLIRGQSLKNLGKTKEALAALRDAAEVGAEFAETHLALGEALAETGQLTEGLKHLENAVRLAKPDDAQPKRILDVWRKRAKQSGGSS